MTKKKGSLDEKLTGEFSEIDLYSILKVDKNATETEIRSAYRKQALLNHPDKRPESEREKAHAEFERIAFAYGILSDEKRRKIYDTTGKTNEVISDIDWTEWIKELYNSSINGETLEEFKKSYQGMFYCSEEERQDLYQAYEQFKGSMTEIFSHVLCSNVLSDEERFRAMIDEGIKNKELKKYKNYTQETSSQRRRRRKNAEKEAEEAEELTKELGLDKTLKKIKTEDDLQALIKQRQSTRMETLINNLEAKYGSSKKKTLKKN
ncbi:hypothetical protein T552_03238 [Pneumocystis carinii B80]|uniref:J domain-containing protein n=1 Tax=Pneumocystis carinii (strain B80) TaxID=1408658 RepID=A0A0W4ZC60_PNEC8|nr:hypothetical protein T552_03238 [Pneumocystis carinii B80]KTW25964.1 hypothetical protein T552_03238 [Pneumocystis carinii B80]